MSWSSGPGRWDLARRSIKPGAMAGSIALVAAVLLAVVATHVEAQAPNEAWRTLETEHFRVTFPEGPPVHKPV